MEFANQHLKIKNLLMKVVEMQPGTMSSVNIVVTFKQANLIQK